VNIYRLIADYQNSGDRPNIHSKLLYAGRLTS